MASRRRARGGGQSRVRQREDLEGDEMVRAMRGDEKSIIIIIIIIIESDGKEEEDEDEERASPRR